MTFKIVEFYNVNRFLEDELPKSIGLTYPPGSIRKYFNIKPQYGIWRFRKKEQKKG